MNLKAGKRSHWPQRLLLPCRFLRRCRYVRYDVIRFNINFKIGCQKIDSP